MNRRTPSRNEDFFHGDELKELRDYIAPIRRARRIRSLVTAALGLWLVFGLDVGPAAASWVDGHGWFLRLLVVIAVIDGATQLATMPLDYWVNLVYEKRAGHSTTTLGTWIKDQILEFVLGVGILGVVFAAIYSAIHSFDQWWVVASALVVGFLVVLQFVAPVVILPRFNKFTPMEDGPIRRRIEDIARQSGVSIQGVYLMDASKRTNRPNAGVTGFGKTKRVIVNDTICDFPMDELSQVIAHELGHYRLSHPFKSIPVTAVQFPLALAFVYFVAGHPTVLAWAGVDSVGDPASYGVLSAGLFLVALKLLNIPEKWLSRKHEREADLEALELLRDPTSFVAAWPRIVLEHKANLEPTWWERLNATHPEISERIQFGLDWAEMNGVPVERPAPRHIPKEPEPAQ